MKRIKLFCYSLVIVLSLPIVVLAGWQEKFIFYPQTLAAELKFRFPNEFQEVYIKSDQAILHGLHFPNSNPKGAILFFHGNAQTVYEWGQYSQDFLNLGYDFYIFDYRGYGKSSGKINGEKNLYNDSDAMFKYVLKKFPQEKITLVGYSIGTGIAASLLTKYQPKNIILFAPYSSLEELIKEKVPAVPSWLIKYKIPTKNFLSQNLKTKTIIFHGQYDTLIPPHHSEKLKNYLKSSDKIFFIPANHNNLLQKNEVWEVLRSFL